MVKIKGDYINLGQLLKLCDFVSSGGEVKIALEELEITINGEKEKRRGRKIYNHDKVIINGKLIEFEK